MHPTALALEAPAPAQPLARVQAPVPPGRGVRLGKARLKLRSAARTAMGTGGWEAGDYECVCLRFFNLKSHFSPRLISNNDVLVIGFVLSLVSESHWTVGCLPHQNPRAAEPQLRWCHHGPTTSPGKANGHSSVWHPRDVRTGHTRLSLPCQRTSWPSFTITM